jgi:type IV secretory pathway VirB4 component
MQDSIKYLYQKRLNKNLKKKLERIEDIYGNILESIHGAGQETLKNQEERTNNKLW